MNKVKKEIERIVHASEAKAGILFVAAVLVIGSSTFLPSLYLSERASELSNLAGQFAPQNKQTGRYLKMPSRF